MLKKEYRLKKFSLNSFRQISTPFFNVRLAKNDSQVNKFAFVVGKKVDKRATFRNLIKRRIRSALEQVFDNLKTGNDFIFYPKKTIDDITQKKTLEELNKFLKKEQLLK